MKYPKIFEYTEESGNGIKYTSAEQFDIEFERLAEGLPDYWEITSSESKKRSLIITDCEADAWSVLDLCQIKTKLAALLDEGFSLYLWYDGSIVPITNLNYLDNPEVREKITPVHPDKIIEAAFEQQKIPRERLHLLNHQQLMSLCQFSDEVSEVAENTLEPKPINTFRLKAGETLSYKTQHLWVTTATGKSVQVPDNLQEIILEDKSIFSNIALWLLFFNNPLLKNIEMDVHSLFQEKESYDSDEDDEEEMKEEENIFDDKGSEFFSNLSITFDHLESFILIDNQHDLGNRKYGVGHLLTLSHHLKTLTIIIDEKSKHGSHLLYLYTIKESQQSELEWLTVSDIQEGINTFFENILPSMPKLRSLTLRHSTITEYLDNEDLTIVSLESLQLINCEISETNFEKLSTHCKHLTVTNCMILDINPLKIFGTFESLEYNACELIEKNIEAPNIIAALDKMTNFCQSKKLKKFSTDLNCGALGYVFADIVQKTGTFFFQTLCLKNSQDVEGLKLLLKSLPQLHTLDLRECFLCSDTARNIKIDTELQQLLDRIPTVYLPNYLSTSTLEKKQQPFINDQFLLPSPYSSQGSVAPSKILSNQTKTVDANVRFDGPKKLEAKYIFYPLNNQEKPDVSSYRLQAYDHVIVSSSTDINNAFSVENKADFQFEEVNHIIFGDVSTFDITQNIYYGRQKFDIREGQWQPIASLSPKDIITHCNLSLEQIQIKYSKRDNSYYISSAKGKGRQEITLDFLIQHAPVKTTLTPSIKQLVEEYRSDYTADGKTKKTNLTFDKENPTGRDRLDAIQTEKIGACRQLSVAFKEWIDSHSYQYPDIQETRIIANDVHMFVEVKETATGDWISCDLGGHFANVDPEDLLSPNELQQKILDAKKNDTKDKDNVLPSSPITHDNSEPILDDVFEESKKDVSWEDGLEEKLPNINTHEEKPLNTVSPFSEISSSDESQEIADMPMPEQRPKQPAYLVALQDYLAEEPLKKRADEQLSTWKKKTLSTYTHPKLYLNDILTGKRQHDSDRKCYKKQLIELPSKALNSLTIALQEQAHETSHPVYYIHSPEDLVCSAAFIKRDANNRGKLCKNKQGGGPLHDFLTARRDPNQTNPPVLIVNYANFSAADIVRFNGLLDEERQADGTPLPEDMIVVGLIDPTKPESYDGEDFYSRFDCIETCPFNTIPTRTSPILHEAGPPRDDKDIFTIDLCHSPAWLTQLMGRWVMRNGELCLEEGELAKAIASGLPIQILNPPKNDAFELFWQQARVFKEFRYRGRTLPCPENLQIVCREGYDWHQCLERIAFSDDLSENAQLLNPQLLREFLDPYRFDHQTQTLNKSKGIFQEHAEKFPDQPLTVFITRNLTDDQWGLFFKKMKEYPQLTLSLHTAPGVILPSVFKQPAEKASLPVNITEKTGCIYSTDRDLTIHQMMKNDPESSTSPWLVLDISECGLSDLIKRLKRNSPSQDADVNEDADETNIDITFTETEQVLLTALRDDKKIILTGNFSHELMDGLMPLLMERTRYPDQALGKLVCVAQKNFSGFLTFMHTVTPEEKETALLQHIPDSFSKDELAMLATEDSQYLAKPFVELVTRLRYKRNYPDQPSQKTFDGLEKAYLSIDVPDINFETSAQEAKAFMEARHRAFEKALTLANNTLYPQPYIFLAGLTGVGKSSFIDKELDPHKYAVFHGENPEEMLAWANTFCTNQDDRTFILFIDEANLSAQQWSQFEGLFYNTPPTLLIDGQPVELTAKHKVVFAGNPLSYDGRHIAPLFNRRGNSIVFQPLSPAFIYEKTIKPVFDKKLSLSLQEEAASEILKVYQFLATHSDHEILMSPRQIKMIAQLVVESYRHHGDDVAIRHIATFHARNIMLPIVNTLSEKYQQAFHDKFPCPRWKPETQNQSTKHYCHTPSRDAIIAELTDFLHVRKNQQNSGLNRLVVQGESGIGKSKMLMHVLRQAGMHKAEQGEPYQESHDVFYVIHASMGLKKQKEILLEAFDRGAIVVIDEINSTPQLEQLMNSLLDGKHPTEKDPTDPNRLRSPKQLGFSVWGTQNPAKKAGRRLASPALMNRTHTINLPEYSPEEMEMILVHDGLSQRRAKILVTSFITKREEAKQHNVKPVPVFRNLKDLAKQEIKAQSACKPMTTDQFLSSFNTPEARWQFVQSLDSTEINSIPVADLNIIIENREQWLYLKKQKKLSVDNQLAVIQQKAQSINTLEDLQKLSSIIYPSRDEKIYIETIADALSTEYIHKALQDLAKEPPQKDALLKPVIRWNGDTSDMAFRNLNVYCITNGNIFTNEEQRELAINATDINQLTRIVLARCPKKANPKYKELLWVMQVLKTKQWLKECGELGNNILVQIGRLEKGDNSYTPFYWKKSDTKLSNIVNALKAAPADADKLWLATQINNTQSPLHKALSYMRLSSEEPTPEKKSRTLKAVSGDAIKIWLNNISSDSQNENAQYARLVTQQIEKLEKSSQSYQRFWGNSKTDLKKLMNTLGDLASLSNENGLKTLIQDTAPETHHTIITSLP